MPYTTKPWPPFVVRKRHYANDPSSWRIMRLFGFNDGRPSYVTVSHQRYFAREDAQRVVDRLLSELSESAKAADAVDPIGRSEGKLTTRA